MISLTTEQAQQIEEALDELRYANNTDIAKTKYYKALSTIRAARAQEQAEQEPEVWYCPDCGTLSEAQVKCCPDWIRSRKVTKNFALTCKATFDRQQREWVEPSDDRLCDLPSFDYDSPQLLAERKFARAVLKLAKELNA